MYIITLILFKTFIKKSLEKAMKGQKKFSNKSSNSKKD